MADTTTYTDEQIAAMREAIAAFDRQRAEALEAQRVALLEPVRSVVESGAYVDTQAALTSLVDQLGTDALFGVHVRALAEIMPRLASVLTAQIAHSAPQTPTQTLPAPDSTEDTQGS